MTNAPQPKPFRVLMTCGTFEPGFKAGGPVRSIAQIVDTAPSDIDVTLVTTDRDVGDRTPYPGLSGQWIARGRAKVFYLNTRNLVHWVRLFRLLRRTRFDLLYLNSLWAPIATMVPLAATWLGLIKATHVLVAPRGELSDGALSAKSRKKRLFLPWWKFTLRNVRATWHATADHEVADIRAAFPSADVLLSPNQTALPVQPLQAPAAESGHARLVFISRISPSKRLDVVLAALHRVTVPVTLDVFGPIEDHRYWQKCSVLIRSMPDTTKVVYRGELAPSDVRQTFHRYDAFVFPTTGENFGHVIAESISASCPVICSDATPWTRVLSSGGGKVLSDPSEAAIGNELQAIAEASSAHRLQQRRRAADAYRSWRETCLNYNVLESHRRRRTAVSP